MKLSDEQVALVCHAANYAYSLVTRTVAPGAKASLDDEKLRDVCRGIKFVRRFPDATPSDLHALWCETAPRDHPCNVDWDAMPPVQQRKDILFKAIIDAIG